MDPCPKVYRAEWESPLAPVWLLFIGSWSKKGTGNLAFPSLLPVDLRPPQAPTSHPEFREGCEKWGLVMGSVGLFPQPP